MGSAIHRKYFPTIGVPGSQVLLPDQLLIFIKEALHVVVEFRNEPFTDFSDEKNRKAFEQALETVRGQLGQTYDLIINGERIRTERKLRRSILPIWMR